MVGSLLAARRQGRPPQAPRRAPRAPGAAHRVECDTQSSDFLRARSKRRLRLLADPSHLVRTARVEAAARRRALRARHGALQTNAGPRRRGIGPRARPTATRACRDATAAGTARRRSPISTSLPRYMTPTRCATCRTRERSCEISRYDAPSVARISMSRRMIEACVETSSAETGSSRTMNAGFMASAARDGHALLLAARQLARQAVGIARVEPHVT